jgi:hypothetical protein
MAKQIGKTAFFLSTIPWVNFGTNNLDSQPWPALAFMVYLFLEGPRVRIPTSIATAASITATGVVGAAITSNDPFSFLALRGATNYLMIFVCLIGAYHYIMRYGLPERAVILSNIIWILFAFVELFNPSIVAAISPVRTTADRGITSLSPEPTFFAVYLIFTSWLLLANRDYKIDKLTAWIIGTNALTLVFLSRSALGLTMISTAFLIVGCERATQYKVKTKFWAMLIAAITLGALGIWIMSSFAPDTRLSKLIWRLSEQGGIIQLFRFDASMNERLEHVLFPWNGLVENGFLPGGFDTYSGIRDKLAKNYEGFFWHSHGLTKIMS